MDCWNGKRIIPLLLLLILAISLSGCWNRRELNTLGIVGMIGMDKAGDAFQLTIEVMKPLAGEGGEGEQAASYVQAKGQTIAGINRNATLKFDRRIFYPHTRLLLFSEAVARMGLAPHADFFLRDHEPRLTTPIYVVAGDTAAAVMGQAAGVSATPSEYLLELWREERSNGKSISVTLLDFVKAYESQGKHPVVGVVRKVSRPKIMKQEKETGLTVEGAAVFKKDKLIGFLDGDETRGYNWLAGKPANWIVVFTTPGAQGRTVVEVLKLKSEKTVELSGGLVKIKAYIDVRGRVAEETAPAVEIAKPPVINKLELATAQAIRAEVEHTLAKVQQDYRADIFGFGQVVHRKYPREWQSLKANWDETFADAETEVSVVVTLAEIGKANRSFAK